VERAVVNLLRFHEAQTAILFCATRDMVRRVHAVLVERGFAAVALSGEHSQNERNHALQALRDGRARVCVATDVAARGIDIATLSLVIHVEVPRDVEVLQHRSGRTGRAGRKGTAVIIVPYPRRRRVEAMLRGARIQAEWMEVPSAASIRAQDNERLLTTLLEPVEGSDDERALAATLLERKSAEEIALALVLAQRRGLPEPEELIDLSGKDRDGDRGKARHREGFEDVVWFRMDVGRRQNADPRWLLPLLCRRGHITRSEIGAIRISANETFFQVPSAVEAKFRAAVKRTAREDAEDESAIIIERAPDMTGEPDRSNARPRKFSGGANEGRPLRPRPHGQRKPAGAGGRPPSKGRGRA
jgi:ATP-dependent RNA helicase DeaD